MVSIVPLFLFLPLYSCFPHQAEDACLKRNEVEDERVDLLLSKLKPSWASSADLRIFRSDALEYEWNWLRSLPVTGLPKKTVYDVLLSLDSSNCSFIAVGDVVWKTVRSLKPTSLHGESSCTIHKLEQTCLRNFGWNACTRSSSCLLIGKETSEQLQGEMSVSGFRVCESSFGDMPSFTVDSLGLLDDLSGRISVVDSTGHGMDDVCLRRLSLPHSSPLPSLSQSTLLRYFELRAADFGMGNDELRGLIERELRNGTFALSVNETRKWFCEGELLKGKLMEENGAVYCFLDSYPGTMVDAHRRVKAARDALVSDTPLLWSEVISPSLDSMQEVLLSPSQFRSLEMETRKWNDASGDEGKDEVILPVSEGDGGNYRLNDDPPRRPPMGVPLEDDDPVEVPLEGGPLVNLEEYDESPDQSPAHHNILLFPFVLLWLRR